MSLPNLDAALDYAGMGWPVIPCWWPAITGPGARCACGKADCRSMAKHPQARLVPHGLKDATTDERAIRAWWRTSPRASVAIVLGRPAAMFALDVDPRHGGDRTLDALERAHGALPRTLRARTGSGGAHVFFKWPGRPVTSAAHRLGPGLDVKGDGGYVLAAPSLHPCGERYAWIDVEAPVVEAPPWLLARLFPPPAPALARSAPAPIAPSSPGRPDATRRAVAYLARIPGAVEGQGGSKVTMDAAVALVRGFDLPPHVALDLLLREFNPRCRPPWSRAELEHKVKDAERGPANGRPAPPRGYLLNESRPRRCA